MFDFAAALALVLDIERGHQQLRPDWPIGYVHIKGDPGGPTKDGITERVARAKGYKGDMKLLPDELRDRIYHEDYWLAAHCDKLPSPLNLLVFDAAVNSGVGAAVRLLQKTVGVRADGVLGPVTLAAVFHRTVYRLTEGYMRARRDMYNELCWRRAQSRLADKVSPADLEAAIAHGKQFQRGWLNRLDQLRAAL